MARQSRADVKADAEAAFIQALEQALAGSVDVTSGEPGGPDLYVSVPGGPTFAVEVKGIATRAEPGPVANALKTWDRQLASVGKATGDDVIGVVVAAALPDAAKGILRDHGWGWFDRRGELHLRAPGLVVHTTEITPDPAAGGRVGREPIRGRAGITTAAGLLLDPDDPPGVREIARQGDLAPSSVSAALTELRTASLVDDRDRPLVPELFWALAGAWKPERHAFAELPEPGAPARLALGLESVEEPGWAVGGTVGAAAWSAPVAVASVAPPDFYVPSERELRAARRELPPAGRLAERACTIAVAPTILAVRPRYEPATTATAWLAWPLVRPLFVALDLAQDRGARRRDPGRLDPARTLPEGVVTGTSVVLAGDSVAAMVRAADRAGSVPGLRLAIVGGLAVTCRLGHVHRATGDVDAVVDDVVGFAADSGAQVLVEHGVATADPAGPEHRVFVDGTKLEIIDTHALPGGAADIEAPLPRLFVLGHRWALESAEQLRVLVAGSDVDVVLPVAAPAALIATKLHAFCDRQQDEKRASDAYDIYRLLQTRDGEGEVARALEGGPSGLAALVADVMHERFVEGAARVVRYLKVFGDPLWEEIRSEDLQDVVGAFTLRLRG